MQANDTAFDQVGARSIEIGTQLFDILKVNPVLLATNPKDAEKMKKIVAFAERFEDSMGEIRRIALNKKNNEMSTLDIVSQYADIASRRYDLQQQLASVEGELQPFIE